MSRFARNKAYHIESSDKLPLKIVIRDILLTIFAWGLAMFFCWDFLLQLTFGVLNTLDPDPLNDLDRVVFSKELKISFLFSGSVLIFIFLWTLSNLRLLRHTKTLEGKKTSPLPLHQEVEAYGCSEDDVTVWRQQKFLTVSISDSGQILEVNFEE